MFRSWIRRGNKILAVEGPFARGRACSSVFGVVVSILDTKKKPIEVEASENHLDFVDTLKYTHPVFSIFVPLLFLFIGGIGLPGGAVYINPAAIRKSGMRALASAAGPLATLLCAMICALPFLFGWHSAWQRIFYHRERGRRAISTVTAGVVYSTQPKPERTDETLLDISGCINPPPDHPRLRHRRAGYLAQQRDPPRRAGLRTLDARHNSG